MLYLEELLRWSPKIDLVSQTDPKEVIRKHFLDSLAVVPFLSEKMTLLDLGSGAGFPGRSFRLGLLGYSPGRATEFSSRQSGRPFPRDG
jgi:hypothetical protein